VIVALLAIVGLIVGAITIRPPVGTPRSENQASEADREAPIVAPSRVVSVDGEARVMLDSAEARRIGLSTVALRGASAGVGRRLMGQVVPEPERTVTLRAPVTGRLSSIEGRSWPALGERVTAGANVARVSDAQPLTVPFAGVVTSVGARPGEIVEAGQVLLELADNSRPVVRIAWPEDAGPARRRVIVLPPRGDDRIEGSLIGAASEADPLTKLPTYLYRASAGWSGAVAGTSVSVILPEQGTVEGPLVPDRAVVQWEGFAWAYIQRGPGQYARVRVPTDRPAAGGWIAGPPLAPGDTVVITGVQELLSEEFRARVTVGEESGE
jgi:hypothetical protein